MRKQKNQNLLINRINDLCREKGMTYYMLSYRSTVPLTTLLHIMDGSTKNPGFYTVIKICDGFGISMAEFVDVKEFQKMEKDVQNYGKKKKQV